MFRLRRDALQVEGGVESGHGGLVMITDDDGDAAVIEGDRAGLPCSQAEQIREIGAIDDMVRHDEDRAARRTAHRVSRLRHDGEGAGAGAEVARVSGLSLGSVAAAEGGGSDFSRARPA